MGHCTAQESLNYASTRVVVAELMEKHGRTAETVIWAQTALQEPLSLNVPIKTRAGRLLGRAHAKQGDHMLSAAALDSALQATKTGELLFSEALVVRARALVGKAAAAVTPHWSDYTGKQRLAEVMGRMEARGDNR